MRGGISTLAELLRHELVRVDANFSFCDHSREILDNIERYKSVPMSFADACLVRLAELHPGGVIFTFDADFRIYRRHGNKVIPVLMPEVT